MKDSVATKGLSHCPFCGSRDIGIRTRKTTIIECKCCNCLFITRNPTQAIKKWETRYEPEI